MVGSSLHGDDEEEDEDVSFDDFEDEGLDDDGD